GVVRPRPHRFRRSASRMDLDQQQLTVTPSPGPFVEMAAPDGSRVGRGAKRFLVGVGRALPPILLLAVLVAIWQIYVEVKDVRPTFLPAPSRVVREGWKYRDIIWGHTKVTMKETA